MNQVLLEQKVRQLEAGAGSGTYAISGGGTTADIVTAIAATQARGLYHLHLGDGTWVIDAQNKSDNSALITMPLSNFVISGNGKDRTVLSIINTTSGDAQNGVNVFEFADGSSNIVFRGLHAKGQNGPFVKVQQNQNAIIHGSGTTSRDVLVQDCYAENLFGFFCHWENHSRCHMIGNTAVNVANSCGNCNSDFSLIHGNVVTGGEGFECSGQAVSIQHNVLYNCATSGISLGGNQAPGSSYPSSVVANNIIDTLSGGIGIIVTDGADAARVQNNTVRKADYGGIVVSAALNPPNRLLISGNTLESNCVDPGTSVVGLDVQCGDGHMIFDNTALDLGVVGFNQKYGLSLAHTDGTVVFGNRFDATLKDASYTATATNVFERGNVYANKNEEWQAANRAPERTSFKDNTVAMLLNRIHDSSGADAYAMFALYPNGTLEWGPDTTPSVGVRDTNLYRRAADQLKTDDKFLAGAGIGVGNSASASVAVGTLVKKIEVFDASGNSLGFVPVYSTIT